jgi:Transposase and inactivated derivatives
MNISRSGYYKWINNTEKKQYELDRENLCELVSEIHKKHPSWEYRRINDYIRRKIGWYVSNNLVHKSCKYLGIKSIVRRKKYVEPGEESITYRNEIWNDWETDKPLEKICTDMTCLKHRGIIYDLVLYVDAFNNEIVAYGTTKNHNAITPYYDGLNILLSKLKEVDYLTVLHSDQGIVYSSKAFENAHKDYNILRSMSRVATPTDNPKMESINGWIKDEIYNDFDIDSYDSFDDFIKMFINYYNYERSAYALNYKTPIEYKIQLGF